MQRLQLAQYRAIDGHTGEFLRAYLPRGGQECLRLGREILHATRRVNALQAQQPVLEVRVRGSGGTPATSASTIDTPSR